jgi:beta-1,4-mannosyl-glycoprotein beta-1,4-N-acetylglucosaminyltransferase
VKIYDLFPFFNEIPLLELRISELSALDVIHGAVELPRTFTDKPKPLYLSDSEWSRSFVRVHVPASYPSGPHPTVDWFQRAQLGQLLWDADPEDIVMISDVDEIPNSEVVQRLIDAGIDEPLTLQSRLYYHRVDLFDPSGPWSGTIIMPRRFLTEQMTAQEWRHRRCVLPQIPDGGWHFSWLGEADAIREKLQAVDIERDSNDQMHHPDESHEFLQSCYETGRDLFSRREHNKIQVPIVPGVNQPHEILEWLEKYPQYAR